MNVENKAGWYISIFEQNHITYAELLRRAVKRCIYQDDIGNTTEWKVDGKPREEVAVELLKLITEDKNFDDLHEDLKDFYTYCSEDLKNFGEDVYGDIFDPSIVRCEFCGIKINDSTNSLRQNLREDYKRYSNYHIRRRCDRHMSLIKCRKCNKMYPYEGDWVDLGNSLCKNCNSTVVSVDQEVFNLNTKDNQFEKMKRCPQCGRTKLLTEFNRDKSKKDGHHTTCKDCRKIHEYPKRNEPQIQKPENQSLFDLLPNKEEIKKEVVLVTSTQERRVEMKKVDNTLTLEKFKGEKCIKIVAENIKVNPNSLTVDHKAYQRKFQRGRMLKVKNEIINNGFYWPSAPIIVNTNHEIIDGQHRCIAAKELGIQEVPIVIYQFASIEDEAQLYVAVNSFDPKQPPVDFWNAQYVAKDPLAIIIYRLGESPTSFLYNRIALKYKKTDKTKFSIPQVFQVLHLVLRDVVTHHRDETLPPLYKAAMSYTYTEIEMRCNVFIKWFYDAFTQDKKANPVPYSSSGFYAVLGFYHRVREAGHLRTDSLSVARKMSSFPFTSEFRHLSFDGKRQNLIDFYNRSRKNKI